MLSGVSESGDSPPPVSFSTRQQLKEEITIYCFLLFKFFFFFPFPSHFYLFFTFFFNFFFFAFLNDTALLYLYIH